jgi:hypothetical protein
MNADKIKNLSSSASTDEFLVCPTVFFAAKMRKIRNKPDGIHFFVVSVPLCG